MCKVWPGLRCQDHTQTKIRKLGETRHRIEQGLSYLEEGQKLTFSKTGEPKLTPITEKEVETHRKKLTDELDGVKTKLDLEQCAYALSAGGRKEYTDRMNNPELPAGQRVEAASILNAALERLTDQKHMGQVLKDPEMTEEEQALFLEIQENAQTNKINQLEIERQKVLDALDATNTKLQETTNELEKRKLEEEKAKLTTQNTTITEKIKQRKALKHEIKMHRQKRQQQIQARFNKLANRVQRLLTWILQPAKPMRW